VLGQLSWENHYRVRAGKMWGTVKEKMTAATFIKYTFKKYYKPLPMHMLICCFSK
jgi:hypothetical protein